MGTANSAEKLAERIRLSKFPLEPEQLPNILSVLSRFSDQLFNEIEEQVTEPVVAGSLRISALLDCRGLL